MTQREWADKDYYADLGVSKSASLVSPLLRIADDYHRRTNDTVIDSVALAQHIG